MDENTINEVENKSCSKCGTSLPLNQQFCGNCGYNFVAKKIDINKKILIPAIVGGVVLIALIIILIVANTPINKFKRDLESDNLVYAVEIYNSNQHKSNFKAIAKSQLKLYSENLPNKFASGKIDEDSARENINILSEIYDFSATLPLIDELSLSKQAFANAEEAQASADYPKAITEYRKVIEADTENYENANEKAEACVEQYSSDLISQADAEIASDPSEKGYSAALFILDEASATNGSCINQEVKNKIEVLSAERKKVICTEAVKIANEKDNAFESYKYLLTIDTDDYSDDFQKTISEYQSNAETFVLDNIQEFLSKKESEKAIEYINNLPSELKMLSSIKSLEKSAVDDFVTVKISEADKKANASSYQSAISILESASKIVSDSRLTNKSKEYQKAADEHYIKSAKDYFVLKKYDDFNHFTRIYPYASTFYSDYSNLYNIRPQLVIYDDGYVNLLLNMGFSAYDWRYMSKITVDCDGKQYKFDVDYSDRDTDVWSNRYSTKIAEVWFVQHYEGVSTDTQLKDLSAMLEEMEKANVVKVRFSGSGGNYDVTLPQSEINKIVVYWKVYNILDRNPELKKYVIG